MDGAERIALKHVLLEGLVDLPWPTMSLVLAEVGILDHLRGVISDGAVVGPWQHDGALRMFISHLSAEKVFAEQLRDHLYKYGIEGFVAHTTIEPSTEWEIVMREALHTMHFFVALLHPGFQESLWCDQETGYAVARHVPIVPVRFGLNPYGFIGKYQAHDGIVHGASISESDLARQLVGVFIHNALTRERMLTTLVDHLAGATYFDQAICTSKALVEENVTLTDAQKESLRQALVDNDQVYGAFYVPPRIEALLVR